MHGNGMFDQTAPSAEPDAHGQAALLLAESTLHTLVEMGVLTIPQAIAVVRSACEVKVEVALGEGESEKKMMESLQLLARIGDSMGVDGGDKVYPKPYSIS